MAAPVYCATKAGMHDVSNSLRHQLKNVKVFKIIPHLIDTEMTKGRGKGEISPERLVKEFISSFKKNKLEINIGKVKVLKLSNRIFPSVASKIMKGAM